MVWIISHNTNYLYSNSHNMCYNFTIFTYIKNCLIVEAEVSIKIQIRHTKILNMFENFITFLRIVCELFHIWRIISTQIHTMYK